MSPLPPVGGGTAMRIGFITLVVAFGGFGVWAGTAPLKAAAVAPGEVKVESYRKTIQHREGGIVRSILVKDGDEVAANQPLVLLDDTAIRATWSQLTFRRWDALTNKARLLAERAEKPTIDFAAVLPEMPDHPHLQEALKSQEQIFKTRREAMRGQVAVLRKQLQLYDREAEALFAEQRSKDRQLALIDEEQRGTQYLVEKGLGRKPQLLALQRQAESLRGERDDYSARIARLRQAQASVELQVTNVTLDQQREIADSLQEIESAARDLDQQLTAARDALQRTIVRSPQKGTVVGLAIHTRGGVLQPGERILDIVPRHDELVVEAHLSPEDIDRVQPGRSAQIRFKTFLHGLTPPAKGTVIQVSADLLHDEKTGRPYYLARVALDPQSLEKLPGPLAPGMQTDVLIATGERTVLGYMLEPLSRIVAVGMTEK